MFRSADAAGKEIFIIKYLIAAVALILVLSMALTIPAGAAGVEDTDNTVAPETSSEEASDAAEEAKQAADVVSARPGGKGVVREYMEKVMKERGDWEFDVALYKKMF